MDMSEPPGYSSKTIGKHVNAKIIRPAFRHILFGQANMLHPALFKTIINTENVYKINY